MNKYVELTTPSLLDIGKCIVDHTKLGYEVRRGPEQIGYLFHVEMMLPDEPVVQKHEEEAPKRGRKAKE